MDIVSIYIIPIGATLGAVSWFWIMRREDLIDEVSQGAKRAPGPLWYSVGRYVYVPCAVILWGKRWSRDSPTASNIFCKELTPANTIAV